jgi:hypothetical protein
VVGRGRHLVGADQRGDAGERDRHAEQAVDADRLAAEHDRDQRGEHRDGRAEHHGVDRGRAREAVDEQLLVDDVAEHRAEHHQRHVAALDPQRAASPRDDREHERAAGGPDQRDRAGRDVAERQPADHGERGKTDHAAEQDEVHRPLRPLHEPPV